MGNEKKPKWTCPVCNKPALMENLLVDGFFTELISSSRLPVDEHEIVLHNDGSWDPLPPKTPEHLRVTDSVPVSRGGLVTETLSLDSDEEVLGSGLLGSKAPPPPAAARRLSTDSADCITLDSDSEEETRPVTKRQRMS